MNARRILGLGRWVVCGLLAGFGAVGLNGCDDGHHDDEVYVADGDGVGDVRQSYTVRVRATTGGLAVANAQVQLIISEVHEQRASALTGAGGEVDFVIATYPGVAVTAYVVAPGLGENFVTGYTEAGADGLVLHVLL